MYNTNIGMYDMYLAHLVELSVNGSAFNIGLITVTVMSLRPMLKAEPLTITAQQGGLELYV